MASISFKGRPTQVLHTYQVWRIGSDENDKSLDYYSPDKVSIYVYIYVDIPI